jgi:hypothetical protein
MSSARNPSQYGCTEAPMNRRVARVIVGTGTLRTALAVALCCACLAIICMAQTSQLHNRTSPSELEDAHSKYAVTNDGAKNDDLMWLLGRWRCLTREYLGAHRGQDPGKPLSYVSEDFLEYFDVFFPYVDENLTTELYPPPRYREIAAQLLVRRVAQAPPFKEELIPMDPNGNLVEICKDRLRIGGPLSNYALRYTRIDTSSPPRLVLESAFTRITLEKLSDTAGDIHSSYVRGLIYFYPSNVLVSLAKKYHKLSDTQQRRNSTSND